MRSIHAQQALQSYNEVQLLRETGWTYQELLEQPDDLIWTLTTVLNLEGEKMQREQAERDRRNR